MNSDHKSAGPGPATIADIASAPDNVTQPSPESWEAKYHALMGRFDAVSDEKFHLLEEKERLATGVNTAAALDELIKPFAHKTFNFMCFYCGFVAVLLFVEGFCPAFKLSQGVLQVLVGSTAATVIGLVGMVLTGVFVGARRR